MGGNIIRGLVREPLCIDVHRNILNALKGARNAVLLVKHSFEDGPGRRIAVLSSLQKNNRAGEQVTMPVTLLRSESDRALVRGGIVEFSDGERKAVFLVTEARDAGFKGRAAVAEPLRRGGCASKETN